MSCSLCAPPGDPCACPELALRGGSCCLEPLRTSAAGLHPCGFTEGSRSGCSGSHWATPLKSLGWLLRRTLGRRGPALTSSGPGNLCFSTLLAVLAHSCFPLVFVACFKRTLKLAQSFSDSAVQPVPFLCVYFGSFLSSHACPLRAWLPNLRVGRGSPAAPGGGTVSSAAGGSREGGQRGFPHPRGQFTVLPNLPEPGGPRSPLGGCDSRASVLCVAAPRVTSVGGFGDLGHSLGVTQGGMSWSFMVIACSMTCCWDPTAQEFWREGGPQDCDSYPSQGLGTWGRWGQCPFGLPTFSGDRCLTPDTLGVCAGWSHGLRVGAEPQQGVTDAP